MGAAARMLPDGKRLHLNHGPIDLIVEAFGPDRALALARAEARFATLLDELVAELPLLRRPLGEARPQGAVARRMVAAVAPFDGVFITPMAAVAGAVADEVLAAMVDGLRLERAYVNNGGDIALWLAPGQALVAALHAGCDAGRVRLAAEQPARGLATSGAGGRSHSLGIADAVSVVAADAAAADAAATLIANAVDLPGHSAVTRRPAHELSPDSDLGARPVTVAVGPLSGEEVAKALASGARAAEAMRERGLIAAAALFLRGEVRLVGAFPALVGEGPGAEEALH